MILARRFLFDNSASSPNDYPSSNSRAQIRLTYEFTLLSSFEPSLFNNLFSLFSYTFDLLLLLCALSFSPMFM